MLWREIRKLDDNCGREWGSPARSDHFLLRQLVWVPHSRDRLLLRLDALDFGFLLLQEQVGRVVAGFLLN
jgi:hypothetical protein